MNRKYSISLFASIIALIALFFYVAYNYSYKQAEKHLLAKQEQEQTQKIDEAVITDGQAEKSEGYILLELNGYVAVYLSDKTTIYEYTNIPIDFLPTEVAKSLQDGIPLVSDKELYGFLENYSS